MIIERGNTKLNNEEAIKFSPNTKFMVDKDYAIVINRIEGLWVKIPKDCEEMLRQCDKLGYSISYLMNSLVDDEDRTYMSKIIKVLEEIKVLGYEEKNSRLHDISFAITNRCNLHCKHCMVNADKCDIKENFTTKEIINALDKIIEAKPEAITITGGEPLVRPDFIKIIKYLKNNYNGKIGLMTNATLITANNINDIISCVSSIDISIDGVDEKSCSIIRGKGVFEKVVSAIKLLKEHNFNEITTSMVLSANNEPLVDKFFQLNEDLGVNGILRALSFVGQAKTNEELLRKEFQSEEKKSSQKLKDMHNSDKFHSCTCAAGCKTLTIENDGNIYPCNLFIEEEHKLGNIMDINNIKDILVCDKNKFLSKSLQKYEPDSMEKCKECNVRYFCWSCLHQIVDVEEDGIFDKRCQHMKKLLQPAYE